METFPGPNFFTWQSYVAESPAGTSVRRRY